MLREERRDIPIRIRFQKRTWENNEYNHSPLLLISLLCSLNSNGLPRYTVKTFNMHVGKLKSPSKKKFKKQLLQQVMRRTLVPSKTSINNSPTKTKLTT